MNYLIHRTSIQNIQNDILQYPKIGFETEAGGGLKFGWQQPNSKKKQWNGGLRLEDAEYFGDVTKTAENPTQTEWQAAVSKTLLVPWPIFLGSGRQNRTEQPSILPPESHVEQNIKLPWVVLSQKCGKKLEKNLLGEKVRLCSVEIDMAK